MHNADKCGTRKLITWEKWTKMREAEAKSLSKKTNRPAVDLVMNLGETIRDDKEEKIVLEHAQIEKKPKIRRGTLWQQPLRLKQNCPCKPVYEIQRTAVEMGEPRVMEHVAVPKTIQMNELGIGGVKDRPVCNFLDLDYLSYKDRRQRELKDKITKLDPYKPEVDHLIIKGEKPKPPPRKLPPLPTISISETNFSEPETSVYALKINGNLFFKDKEGEHLQHLRELKASCKSNCTQWSYYFNVPMRRAGRSKLHLENLGTVSLKYFWRRIQRHISFIPEDFEGQVFFFNKNEDVICPGQSKDIVFTLFCDRPGFFNENWELCIFNYNFFDASGTKFEVNLSADVTEDTDRLKERIKIIKEDILTKAKFNIVGVIIDDIFDKATAGDPQIYPYVNLLLEADIFVMKNPVCYYHQTEVGKLKDKYAELTGDAWDLSIISWRKAMMTKEYAERMANYDFLMKSHNDLLKPWNEGDELMTQKLRAVKQLLLQLADKFDEEFRRIYENNKINTTGKVSPVVSQVSVSLLSETIQSILYITMYDHICTVMEFCAGVLSSLDCNRWIDIDFCHY